MASRLRTVIAVFPVIFDLRIHTGFSRDVAEAVCLTFATTSPEHAEVYGPLWRSVVIDQDTQATVDEAAI